MDLRPIQRNRLEQLHLLGDAQDLDEQPLDFGQEPLAECAQRVVIGMGIGGDVAKRDRVMGGLLDAPATEGAGGIAVDQQRQQHRRVIRRRACAAILAGQRRQVQLLDNVHHKARHMVLGQPFIHRWRQQILGIAITLTEVAHRFSLIETIVDLIDPNMKSSTLSPTGC